MQYVDAFLAWLKSKNITSHTVVVAIVFLATALVEDQQVRDFFISMFQTHPKIVAVVISLAGIIFKYSRSSAPPPVDAAAKYGPGGKG